MAQTAFESSEPSPRGAPGTAGVGGDVPGAGASGDAPPREKPTRRYRWWRGEALGGYATAVALVVTVLAAYWTSRAQDEFNVQLASFAKEGARAQKEAAEAAARAAKLQREANLVQAFAPYINSKSFGSDQAWATSSAVFDLAGDDQEWRATAARMIVNHPKAKLECDLYSPGFVEFAAERMGVRKADFCLYPARRIKR